MIDPKLPKEFFMMGYIDPGSGYVFSSVIPAVIGFVITFISAGLIFLRKNIVSLLKKRRFIIIVVGIVVLVSFLIFMNQRLNSKVNKKVVVIGLDGLDPKILNEGISQNLLPNFAKLKNDGYFSPLQTVMPPQSPVAWASFITASYPAKHGVYDFIERNPKNYSLDLVFNSRKENMFNKDPFWKITSQNKIPTTVLFLPDTFYPSELEGNMTSGMGVPDVQGTAGTFTLITSKSRELDPKWRGKLVSIPNNNEVTAQLPGPKYVFLQETKVAEIPIKIKRAENGTALKIDFQGNSFVVRKGAFSPWAHITFSIDFFTKVNGIVKFYVKEVDPEIELYVSPVNFDPEKPLHPISFPKNYSKNLSQQYGLYSTLGLPHDTWALEENIFDEDAFLTESDAILNERKKIYFGELKKFKQGIFFGYFGTTDTIQHMYWRFLKDDQSKYQKTIMNYYQRVDAIVGETLKTLSPKDTLIVLSDHGFDAFDYEINLNTWLKENGYLTLKDNKTIGVELLTDVDWSKTKAYAIGYNGIYFNRQGREGQGIVDPKEVGDLEKEMIPKLLELTNEENGQKIIKKVYARKELQVKDSDINAPDLFIGFYKGARSSWDTAIGAAPESVVKRRESKWSGDHLYDPSEVPGVLLINKKLNIKNPRIVDIIPTVLDIFKAPLPKAIDGINLITK